MSYAADLDSLAVSGSATSAAVLFTQDMTGYSSANIQVTSLGSGNTLIAEMSEDQVSWGALIGTRTDQFGAVNENASITMSLTVSTALPRHARYMRIRCSVYGSGTVSVVGTLSKAEYFRGNLIPITGATGAGQNYSTYAGHRIYHRARTSRATAVSNDQTVDPLANTSGIQITRPWALQQEQVKYVAASGGITNTTPVTIFSAAPAGIKNYINSVQISYSALTTATELAIRDGSGGTVLWRILLPAGSAEAGKNFTFEMPIESSTATLLEVVLLTNPVAGAVYFNAQGHQDR